MLQAVQSGLGRLLRGILKGIGRTIWALVRPGLRVASVVMMLGTAIVLTSDVTRWQIGQEGALFQTLGGLIRAIAPATLDGLGQVISRQAHPFVWDPLLSSILGLPAWALLFALAVGCGYLARERRQVDIFIN